MKKKTSKPRSKQCNLPTYTPPSVNKNSNMDTHRNKNETKQMNLDQNSEIDPTQKPVSEQRQ